MPYQQSQAFSRESSPTSLRGIEEFRQKRQKRSSRSKYDPISTEDIKRRKRKKVISFKKVN